MIVSLVSLLFCLGLAWTASLGMTSKHLLVLVGVSFGVQWLAYIPAALLRTERFFDLMGSVGFLILTGVALASEAPDLRKYLVAGAVVLWALRLGSFLVIRVRRDGKDRRFDKIKTNPTRFFLTWNLQATWVFTTLLAVLIILVEPPQPGLRFTDFVGLAMWALGFGIEALSDAQKRAFRAQAENNGRFIRSGLWAWSRHPNYFGEILLWAGLAVVGAGVYQGFEWVGLVSPFFVALLLIRVSGIPLLEAQADERWGKDSDYQQYKAATPVLVPRPPRS